MAPQSSASRRSVSSTKSTSTGSSRPETSATPDLVAGRLPGRCRRASAADAGEEGQQRPPLMVLARVRTPLVASFDRIDSWIQRASSLHPACSSWPGRAAWAKPPSAPPWPSPRPAQGLSVLLVEIEGKSGLASLFGPGAAGLRRGRPGRRDQGPHDHARRGPARVPAHPRPVPHLQAAGVVGGPGDRGHLGAGHPRHPRARHGQARWSGPAPPT